MTWLDAHVYLDMLEDAGVDVRTLRCKFNATPESISVVPAASVAGYGYGDGYGYGYGYGDGYGDGYGYGDDGYSNGYGYGDGCGYDDGRNHGAPPILQEMEL